MSADLIIYVLVIALFPNVVFLIIAYKWSHKVINKVLEESIEVLLLKQKTQLTESVKNNFNQSLEAFKKNLQVEIVKEVEPFKAALSKDNIAFQISHTEYIRRQYIHLEELFASLYELRVNVSFKIRKELMNYESFESENIELSNLLQEYIRKIHISSFYLNENSRKTMFLFSNNVKEIIQFHGGYQKLLRNFDGLKYFDFVEIINLDDDVEYKSYTDSEINDMEQEIKLFKEKLLQLKIENKRLFYEADMAIRSSLHSTKDNNNDLGDLKKLTAP